MNAGSAPWRFVSRSWEGSGAKRTVVLPRPFQQVLPGRGSGNAERVRGNSPPPWRTEPNSIPAVPIVPENFPQRPIMPLSAFPIFCPNGTRSSMTRPYMSCCPTQNIWPPGCALSVDTDGKPCCLTGLIPMEAGVQPVRAPSLRTKIIWRAGIRGRCALRGLTSIARWLRVRGFACRSSL